MTTNEQITEALNKLVSTNDFNESASKIDMLKPLAKVALLALPLLKEVAELNTGEQDCIAKDCELALIKITELLKEIV